MTHEYSLGIDIGGTFTDIVLYRGSDAQVFSYKELTTPNDPAVGAMRGIDQLLMREAIRPEEISRVVHATTLFTNALIERRGAPTGLITTAGFRDTLELRREYKYDLYDLFIEMPRPLVPRALRLEVDERTNYDGAIAIDLDQAQLIAAAQELVSQGVQSLAIVFLHAYANPTHENRAKEIIHAHFPHLQISISSEVSAQIREFERTCTTVANAYIKPIADRYLRDLEARLSELGITGALFMMLSNGGLTHVDEARRVPIQLLESGPAAGAIAAAYFGKRSQIGNLLAFDMGGTTAKLSIIEDSKPLISHQFEAARERRFATGSGMPINISTVELIEIGAGGGSIAHLDSLGLLKVGPRSAGSQPGPACYDRGGSEPTVTDANLLAGYFDAATFAGGTMKLSTSKAQTSIESLAGELGMHSVGVAKGVQAVVNESMAAAARVHVAERGHNAADFTLLLTGGGGPLHGCDVARRLGIRTLICPPGAGVASALGLLIAPARVDRSATLDATLDSIDVADLERAFVSLEREASKIILATIAKTSAFLFNRAADLRFVGQGFELVTALPSGPYDASHKSAIRDAFMHAYRRVFGEMNPDGDIEIINVRVTAIEALEDRPLALSTPADQLGKPAGTRRVYHADSEGWIDVPVMSRSHINYGDVLVGPMLIEDASSTLVVPEHATVMRDAADNLLIELDAA